jgi:hypothetical protein
VTLVIPPPAFDWLYVFLPLALAGFVTAVLICVPSFAQLFADRHKDSK